MWNFTAIDFDYDAFGNLISTESRHRPNEDFADVDSWQRYFYVSQQDVRRLTFRQNLMQGPNASIVLVGTTMQGADGKTIAADNFLGGQQQAVFLFADTRALRVLCVSTLQPVLRQRPY